MGDAMRKPIKGTNESDELLGTARDDRIEGKGGDDVISGQGGHDWIDGGRGVDTAVYAGGHDDYLVFFRGTGNHKAIVLDTVGGRDGVDYLKHVEFLRFNDAVVDVKTGEVTQWQYSVNASVDASAQDPSSPGNLFVGSGIPATNFAIAENVDAGVELGLQVIYRQGPAVASTDTYDDGVLHFVVNDGPQSTANGSSANNVGRASWSFEYSIATGLNGATTDLGDFTFKLLYDVDPGAAASYRTLTLEQEATPQAAGQSGFQWRDEASGLVFIADDEGNANVTQNSENYAFTFFQSFLTGAYGPGNAFSGPAHFDIQLQAYDDAQLIAVNHIAVDVIL
jgi:hypothetical protein